MSDWNGEERRRGYDRRDADHDLLIQIHTMVTAIKETHVDHVKAYDKHVMDDDDRFDKLIGGQQKSFWYIAVGFGIIAAAQFFLQRGH